MGKTMIAWVGALALAACAAENEDAATTRPRDEARDERGPSSGPMSSSTANADGDSARCGKMDVLFVVSNANGMIPSQNALAASVPSFLAKLDAARIDYRVAVTSSDTFSPDGMGQLRAGCDLDRAWLEPGDSEIAAKLACRAKTGATSCIDRPLEAAKLALTKPSAFLRDDAFLALVIVTDEDEGGHVDAPAAPVSTYPAVFDDVKKKASLWSATVIGRDASCPPRPSFPYTAARLSEFVGYVGAARASFAPICAPDLSGALDRAYATAATACDAAASLR